MCPSATVIVVASDRDLATARAASLATRAPALDVEAVADFDRVRERLADGCDCLVTTDGFALGAGGLSLAELELPTVVLLSDGATPSEAYDAGASAVVDPDLPDAGQVLANRVRAHLSADRMATSGIPDDTAELRDLVETAPVPIGIVAADRTVVYCNDATVEFIGASDRSEVVGESAFAFATEDTREEMAARIDRVIEDREPAPSTERRFTGADGSERVAIVSTTPITYDGEPAAQFVFNDITEFERARAELKREQQFVDTVLNALDDVFYVVDEAGNLVRWNDALPQVTGYTRPELQDMKPWDFVAPDHWDRMPTPDEGFGDLENHTIQLDVLTTGGQRIPHEFSAVSIDDPETGETYRCGIARDITERQRREQELRQFKEAVEHAGHGIFITDDDGRIEYANPAFESITGYDAEEMIGRTPDVLRSNYHDEAYFDRLWETILDGEIWDEEIVNERKNGERYHARQTIAPIVEDGETRKFVAIQQDISELKAYEARLEAQNERLENVASLASHDLRNPLSVASDHLTLATEHVAETCSSPEAEAELSEVADALSRMERIIDDVLRLARQGQAVDESEPVDLDESVRDAWEHVSTGDATLETAGELRIEADPSRLSNLFENLFRNAVEHGDAEGGTVTVGPLEASDDGRVGFFVADDGPGIPPEDRDRVLESGYSTSEDGSGFGLAIVRRIAEGHDWTITVTESETGGVRFEFHDVEPA